MVSPPLEARQGQPRRHVSGNEIALVTGLEHCPQLEELGLANQSSPEPLVIAPPSLEAVSGCLRVLNVAGCRLQSLAGFEVLSCLERLLCDNNNVADMAEVAVVLRECPYLSELSIRDNPVSALRGFQHKAIAVSRPNLSEFPIHSVPLRLPTAASPPLGLWLCVRLSVCLWCTLSRACHRFPAAHWLRSIPQRFDGDSKAEGLSPPARAAKEREAPCA